MCNEEGVHWSNGKALLATSEVKTIRSANILFYF